MRVLGWDGVILAADDKHSASSMFGGGGDSDDDIPLPKSHRRARTLDLGSGLKSLIKGSSGSGSLGVGSCVGGCSDDSLKLDLGFSATGGGGGGGGSSSTSSHSMFNSYSGSPVGLEMTDDLAAAAESRSAGSSLDQGSSTQVTPSPDYRTFRAD
jgi:hypothetical protein